MNILIVRGDPLTPATALTAEMRDAIDDANVLIALNGSEAEVIEDTTTPPDLEPKVGVIDVRGRGAQYVEDGERLSVTLGAKPREDDIRTAVSGIPIRGVTAVTMEDDMEKGRAILLRLRVFDLAGSLVSDDQTPTQED